MKPEILKVAAAALAGLALTAPTCNANASANVNESNSQRVSVQLTGGVTIMGCSYTGSDYFNGIPYAQPPVGNLRLRPPQRHLGGLGTFDGTGTAAACPQVPLEEEGRQIIASVDKRMLELPFWKPVEGVEDCLTVSVQRPSGTRAGAKLPVLFWIYGGGFIKGSTSTYDATSLVAAASADGLPFIYVAVNYRLGAFGFLPGAEILKNGSANLGWLDQRMALEWVADNIEHFGGDPDKVTLWGESAGSISVFGQMALYGGNATYKGKPPIPRRHYELGQHFAYKPYR